MTRNDFPQLLNKRKLNGNWLELGVCEGIFSEHLLSTSNCKVLYSIDRWAGDRGHNDNQYLLAKVKLFKFKDRSIIKKQTFNEAAFFMENDFFDFIYIDGYAHTGQDNGETLDLFWDKLKKGGIFAGHDYDKQYPLNIEIIDEFIKRKSLKLLLTDEPILKSWYVIKKEL